MTHTDTWQLAQLSTLLSHLTPCRVPAFHPLLCWPCYWTGCSRNACLVGTILYGFYPQVDADRATVTAVYPPTFEPDQASQTKYPVQTHMKDIQDCEFTVENGVLFMLQTRNGKRAGAAALRVAMDMEREGLLSKVGHLPHTCVSHSYCSKDHHAIHHVIGH